MEVALMPFGSLLAALEGIHDPRRPQGQRYSLSHLLLFAVLAGATSYQKIITFIAVQRDRLNTRAIAYEKSGRWFTAEEPFLRAQERTDAGSSAFRHPRSELIAPLPQEVEPAFNNRKIHMRLPCIRTWSICTGRRNCASTCSSGWPSSAPRMACGPESMSA